MNLKTEIKLSNYPISISHEDKILSIGSCFSENIGAKLKDYKFDILTNPHGIVFNPISISTAINECLEGKQYKESDLNKNGEIYFSYNHHGSFSGLNQKEVLEAINDKIKKGNEFIENSDVLILTFGSAWIYRRKQNNEVVANCHKVPTSEFTKELLSVSEVVERITDSINRIKSINPSIKILTTISPVRHWKDGVVENQQSKATLHLALKEINERFEDSFYFPSYEIMMDELRDYRFYGVDMLHPSELAIDYIWEKFADSFVSTKTKILNEKILKINQGLMHKPFESNSLSHKKFRKKLLDEIIKLENEYKFLDFSKEKKSFIQ
ncbi:MAG: GSCFA domain-containing protein [Flavobacteriales bacterium]